MLRDCLVEPAANARPARREKPGSRNNGLALGALGALGVVFGDIGTSPIYALREAVLTAHTRAEPVVMGVLSMILWAVAIVVVLKYACFVMRADNEGEGGIVALTALVRAGFARAGQPAPRILLLAGLAGAAMFYGDSMITPAISVLSAVEGLHEIDGRQVSTMSKSSSAVANGVPCPSGRCFEWGTGTAQ